MKKYYWVWLYQVKNDSVGLKSCIIPLKIQTFPNAPINKIIENQEHFKNIQIILVERILPYHVKEVRTGLIFPILNIDNKNSYRPSTNHKITYPFGKLHTFVFSENNKVIGRQVKSIKELEWYIQEHFSREKYKQELKEVFNTGKIIVNKQEQKVKRKQKKK